MRLPSRERVVCRYGAVQTDELPAFAGNIRGELSRGMGGERGRRTSARHEPHAALGARKPGWRARGGRSRAGESARVAIVGVFRGSSGVVRLAFALFAGVALILVFVSLALLIAGPGDRWPIAVVGVLAAAVLEISWLRVGSVPHRSPVI